MNTYVVDIGTEINRKKKENFAWISENGKSGNRLSTLKDSIQHDLKLNTQISIGFESPLFFDIFDENVNQQRLVDGGKPWSASAGATATVTGLTQIFWLFNALSNETNELQIEILKDFTSIKKGVNIYVWEAFVSGNAKIKSEKRSSHNEN